MKYYNYHMEVCPICQCEIFPEDERYVMPNDDIIHTDCLLDWAEEYKRLGEVDMGWGEYDE